MRNPLPMMRWLSDYRSQDAGNDLVAAIIVTIMLVPQSLAYAMLAGLPPQTGLYASVLPLMAYAIFGSSRTLSVGPVAITSLMTAAAAGKLAADGSPEYAQAALALAALSGLMLITMSLLRLGFLASLLSHPVISGFISASAVLIAASQLKHLLGISAEGDNLPELAASLAGNLSAINPVTLALGSAALLFLLWSRHGLRRLLAMLGMRGVAADIVTKAGPLAVILLAIAATGVLELDARGVKIVGAIPAGLPPLALPVFDAQLWVALLPAALLISLVGFAESVSVAQTLAAKRRERINPDHELAGLGAANIAAAVTGGMPVTGGFARSIVNFEAGARTPLAGVFAGMGILLASLYLTSAFWLLPQAVLGATIIAAVTGLIDTPTMKRVWRYSKADFSAMAATMLLVLLEGVETGIVAGVALSLALFVWRTSRPHMAVVGQVPGTEHFRNVTRHEVITEPGILSVRVDESLYFINARYLEDMIYDMAVAGNARDVVLVCAAVNLIDASALESLESLARRLHAAGVGFHLSEVKGPVMDGLRRSSFLEHFEGEIFLSQFEAMQALRASKKGAEPARAPVAS